MAVSHQPINGTKAQKAAFNIPAAKLAAGIFVLAFVAILASGSLIALAISADIDLHAGTMFDSYLWRVLRFTLIQALASSLLSVLIAIPVAHALYVLPNFRGRLLILKLFSLPLALPALVTILGITGIFGRNGFLLNAASWLGMPLEINIYGLPGILLAHVFFNMPLAVRLLLSAYNSIPQEYWRLSSQLGLDGRTSFRLLEWPVIRRNLPGIAGLIFMLCITSFTTVLTLGGGPRATTLEVAIYQSLHYDFDLARAVILTLTQLALTIIIVLSLRLIGSPSEEGFSIYATASRFNQLSATERWLNSIIIAGATLFVAAPLVMVTLSGLMADLARLVTEAAVWRAIITSLVLGFCAALIASALALALVVAREGAAGTWFARLLDSSASLILVIPPIVIGAGWFILIRHIADPFVAAPFMVVTVNAAMAMPFAVRVMGPVWDTAAIRNNRLCTQLGISGMNRLRIIDWPLMRAPFGIAFAFSMALSLGDLGTIALFGSDSLSTLPYLLLQRMGSYRTHDAAGLALILGLLCLVLMLIVDRNPAGKTENDSNA